MKIKSFQASVAGPGNFARGVQKQDAAMVRHPDQGCFVAACDGLGSRKMSGLGARQACLATLDTVLASKELDEDLQVFCTRQHEMWVNRIAPVTPNEAATTCLFAYTSGRGTTTIGQIGDGLVLVQSQGFFECLTPERDGFSDQTRALGAVPNDADWSIYQRDLSNQGDGVILMTDGISDDLDHGRLAEFFDMIKGEALHRSRRAMRRWLTYQLHDWSTPGHVDDKSITGFFWGTT